MKLRTFAAGEDGFLYVDLLAAITILALVGVTLISSGRNLVRLQTEAKTEYSQTLEAYEAQLLENTQS